MATRLPTRPLLYPVVDLAALGDRAVGPAVRVLADGGARVVQIRAKRKTDLRNAARGLLAVLGVGAGR